MDHILYIEKWEQNNGLKVPLVKWNILGTNFVLESEFCAFTGFK